jgi:catechol 2,3-dioxygenase-like lactoylglutathione lyase family enzyme
MKLDYVRLLVNKFDECFRFYRDVMGFKVTWGREGEGYASFDAGTIGLAIFQRQVMARDVGTTNLPSDAACQDRLALIFGVKSLEATVNRLEERGARFVTRPTSYPDYGTRSAHLRDPDGTLIEIYSQLPKTRWSKELREEGKQLIKK